MINQIKTPVMMISAGILFILAALMIPLIQSNLWANWLLTGAGVLGAVTVIIFFVAAIKRAKAPTV